MIKSIHGEMFTGEVEPVIMPTIMVPVARTYGRRRRQWVASSQMNMVYLMCLGTLGNGVRTGIAGSKRTRCCGGRWVRQDWHLTRRFPQQLRSRFRQRLLWVPMCGGSALITPLPLVSQPQIRLAGVAEPNESTSRLIANVWV